MSTIRVVRTSPGVYAIRDGDTDIGVVSQVWFGSHIRRGRMQTRPWWRANRSSDGLLVIDGRTDAWQTRADAVDALVRDTAR